MQSMRKRLSDEGLLSQLFSDTAVDAWLTAMQIDTSRAVSPTREEGQLVLGLVEGALGVLDLNIVPPGPNVPRAYVLSFDGAPGARIGFRLAMSLVEGPPQPLFRFLEKLPGQGLPWVWPSRVGPRHCGQSGGVAADCACCSLFAADSGSQRVLFVPAGRPGCHRQFRVSRRRRPDHAAPPDRRPARSTTYRRWLRA